MEDWNNLSMGIYFSVVNFMKCSKHRLSICDENVASKLRCAIGVKNTLDFKTQCGKK